MIYIENPVLYGIKMSELIKKQIETILERIRKSTKFEDSYCEIGVWLIDAEESVNFVIDDYLFKYEIDEKFLLVHWNGGEDDDPTMYSSVFNLSQVAYITDEV